MAENDRTPPQSTAGPTAMVVTSDGGRVLVPDEVGLLTAEFSRRGPDLAIGNPDAPALVVLDYFVADAPADLATSGGGVLPGRVVETLAGPDAVPGAGPEAMAPEAVGTGAPIGQVEQLDGEVLITHADGSRTVAGEGTPVFQDDVVTTDGGGAVGLRFVDGMTLSLGSDARMVLDEFAYDPATDQGGGVIDIIQGAFSFVSGKAAHVGLDSLVIDTPTMTIGIRGTKVVAQAAAEGETTTVVLMPEDDGTIGKIMIGTDAGQELLEQPFVSTTVTSRFLPPAPQTFVAPDWVLSTFSKPLAFLPPDHQAADSPARDLVPGERAPLTDDLDADEAAALDEQPTVQAWAVQASAAPRPAPEPASASPTPEASIAPVGDQPAGEPEAVEELLEEGQPLLPAGEFAPETVSDSNPPSADGTVPDDAPVDDAPVVVAPIGASRAAEDAAFSYDVATSFADDGDALTFTAEQSGGAPLPAWLSIDPTTGVLSGTPANANVGGLTIAVTATDASGASAISSFQLTVTNSNDAPVVVASIADRATAEDVGFSYDAAQSFADDDTIHGDSLTYAAKLSGSAALPAWLTIDAATGELSGTPANGDVGVLDVEVTAVDGSGASAMSAFQLTVTNTNDAPLLDDAASPTLTAIAVNTTDPAGDAVGDIVVDGSITDVDGAAVEAIAVTGVDETNGSWEYSTDAGNSWFAVGAVSDSSARLLDASGRLRFVPDAGFDGNATFTFRAWDQTVGSSGEIVDASVNGGTTAYSATSDSASIEVLDTALNFGSGAEFQVNTTTTDVQETPAIAALDDGGYVVVWQSKDQDGDYEGIFGQRFDSAGSPAGVEFQVNSYATDKQEAPAVTGLDGGGFVVTWQSKDQDGDVEGIFGQRFDAAGSPSGVEFQINTTTANEQESPSVAALADGGFVVAWQSWAQDVQQWGVFGQRFDAAGSPQGAEFQVNTQTALDQRSPSVAALDGGGFVVTWQSWNQDGQQWGVYGQRFDATGNAAGAEFQVNTYTVSDQQSPSVAALADGGFVVAWQSYGQDGDRDGVYGQRFDAAGNAVEFEFQVNTTFAGPQKDPSVIGLADGGFLVTWGSEFQDGDVWGVYGQRFNADGDALGQEFLINTTTADAQKDPTVTVLTDGDVVVGWTSNNQDGDAEGVFGHHYENETASVTVNPPAAAAASRLDFGSSNSFVDAGDPGPSANALDPGARDFTVEAWFYYGGPGGTQSIVSKGNATEFDAGFNIFLDGNQLVVRAATDFGIDAAAAKVTLSATPGWHHVAMVIDQEAGAMGSTIKGYLDGSDGGWTPGHGLAPNGTLTTDLGSVTTSSDFLIGAVDAGFFKTNYFDAEIADVRVWNTARSANEIQADLGRTLDGDENHLIANWRLDDGAGATAADSGPGGYDGTLGGGPAWESATGFTIARDTSVTGRISATDAEGDVLSYEVAAGPSNGSAVIDPQSGAWSYTPDAGYSGGDSVSYQVSDGNGGVDTVAISITVTP